VQSQTDKKEYTIDPPHDRDSTTDSLTTTTPTTTSDWQCVDDVVAIQSYVIRLLENMQRVIQTQQERHVVMSQSWWPYCATHVLPKLMHRDVILARELTFCIETSGNYILSQFVQQQLTNRTIPEKRRDDLNSLTPKDSEQDSDNNVGTTTTTTRSSDQEDPQLMRITQSVIHFVQNSGGVFYVADTSTGTCDIQTNASLLGREIMVSLCHFRSPQKDDSIKKMTTTTTVPRRFVPYQGKNPTTTTT
jgi:hypothetical protein